MKLFQAITVATLLLAANARAAGDLLEGSVDACALLTEADVRGVVGDGLLKVDKGVLRETWGSACRWTVEASGAFVSVVAHTKHGETTFRALKRHLPGVKDLPGLGSPAYRSGNKIFLLRRRAYLTVEWEAVGASPSDVDRVVRAIVTQLDELAKRQAVHR